MEPIIHNAVHKALTEQPSRDFSKKLWVSDLGKNPYFALKRLLTGELEQFDYATLVKMDNGNALEAVTLRQAAENLSRPIRTQFPLYNSIWSGYADLVIGHGSEDVIIYDHKASAGKWWDYKGSLPRATDCCQLWMYGQLYEEMFGVKPKLGLYYRGWGAWGEFRVEPVESKELGFNLHVLGQVTDEKGEEVSSVIRVRNVNPAWLRKELENLYLSVQDVPMAIEQVEAMNPNGPDRDYAENACIRLADKELR